VEVIREAEDGVGQSAISRDWVKEGGQGELKGYRVRMGVIARPTRRLSEEVEEKEKEDQRASSPLFTEPEDNIPPQPTRRQTPATESLKGKSARKNTVVSSSRKKRTRSLSSDSEGEEPSRPIESKARLGKKVEPAKKKVVLGKGNDGSKRARGDLPARRMVKPRSGSITSSEEEDIPRPVSTSNKKRPPARRPVAAVAESDSSDEGSEEENPLLSDGEHVKKLQKEADGIEERLEGLDSDYSGTESDTGIDVPPRPTRTNRQVRLRPRVHRLAKAPDLSNGVKRMKVSKWRYEYTEVDDIDISDVEWLVAQIKKKGSGGKFGKVRSTRGLGKPKMKALLTEVSGDGFILAG
jgi:hypothetical protein